MLSVLVGDVRRGAAAPSLLKMSESEALLPVPTPPMMNDAAKMAARHEEDGGDPALAVADPDDHVGDDQWGGRCGSRRRERASAAAGRARSNSVESTPYSTSPPIATSVTSAGEPPSTSAETGSSQGQNGVRVEPHRDEVGEHARARARRDRRARARGRRRAWPVCSAEAVESASGSPALARASSSAARSSSNMSSESADDGLSVPRPTRTPAARRRASGATPQPSSGVRARAVRDRGAARGERRRSPRRRRAPRAPRPSRARAGRARRARGSDAGRRGRPKRASDARAARPAHRARAATRRGA